MKYILCRKNKKRKKKKFMNVFRQVYQIENENVYG